MVALVNPTQLTPPRVNLIDERSGAISREWYRFFLSLLTATETNQTETEILPDAASLLASELATVQNDLQSLAVSPPSRTGVLPTMEGGTGQTNFTDGQVLIGSTAANTLVKALLTAGANITITNAAGSITVAVSGLGTMAFENIGVSGSFTAGLNTVTVVDGIITSIV